MKTTRIVRCAQGAWKWQTPYQVVTYEARAGAGGRLLIWRILAASRKLTLDRAIAATGGRACMGGLGNRRVMSDTDRDAVYSRDL